ncbi:hypothetical protein IMSHALPRED_005412 [Imshaugia aleurites]|uniref:Uncharacterized protein n=1 Tax=Imshaugia aleurites TaxID=172621 RepID=A0A8H3EMX4_9LECA|nr:hypothetical protein IMSHALPRED_005412 [Imshaugia aleurites]
MAWAAAKLHQFDRAHDDLATTLEINVNTKQPEQESRVKMIQTIARWSFTKREICSILERITRIQFYANTLLLDEQYSLCNEEKLDRYCLGEAIEVHKLRLAHSRTSDYCPRDNIEKTGARLW